MIDILFVEADEKGSKPPASYIGIYASYISSSNSSRPSVPFLGLVGDEIFPENTRFFFLSKSVKKIIF